MAREPTWQDRAEYAVARAIARGISLLPERAAESVGEAVGSLVRSPAGIRRQTVVENLRRAFPDAPAEWIARQERATYRHLGREAVAMLRLAALDRESIIDRTRIRGWEAFAAAVAEGRGVLLVTGHLGNWEVAAAAVAARGIPIDAVVKGLRNPLVDVWLDETRRRLGVGTIDMSRAPAAVPRALARGHAIGIVADQDARGAGVWIPFFGHPASTHRGPALFALRLGTPLFASSIRRNPGGGYDLLAERIPVERTGDLEADVERVTRQLAERLELAIRADPEQYFWLHKRWKSAAPAEPPSPLAGTTPAGEVPAAGGLPRPARRINEDRSS